MMKLERGDAPEILQENWEQWGEDYAVGLRKNPRIGFQWRNGCYEVARTVLIAITRNHCSYCDCFPLGIGSLQTIDHFYPKKKSPEIAYKWDNLFICCNVCNTAKGEKFDEYLLKPDEYEYEFSRYFAIDSNTGEIKANAHASEEDRRRAEVTIRVFRLDEPKYQTDRKRWIKVYRNTEGDKDINDFPYRYLFL